MGKEEMLLTLVKAGMGNMSSAMWKHRSVSWRGMPLKTEQVLQRDKFYSLTSGNYARCGVCLTAEMHAA